MQRRRSGEPCTTSSGRPAAVIRAGERAAIGSGVTGPGAALWVEVTPVEEAAPTGRTRELTESYKKLVVAVLPHVELGARDRVALEVEHAPVDPRRRPRRLGSDVRAVLEGGRAGDVERAEHRRLRRPGRARARLHA